MIKQTIMKEKSVRWLLLTLVSMMSVHVSAYRIEVTNSEGVSIYYNYINNTELEVTYRERNSQSYRGTVTIPETVTYDGETLKVTSIGTEAFANCTALTAVTIPNSVTTVKGKSFAYCYSLTSVTIPGSVKTIGNNAFQYCNKLAAVTLSNGLTTIGKSVFQDCTALASITIPSSVTTIDDYAFRRCTALTTVDMSEGVTTIGVEVFVGCTSLTTIAIPNSLTFVGEGAFAETAWYASQPDGVIYTGEALYTYKGTMPQNTSVVIREGIKTISVGALKGCEGLTSVTIPTSVTTIGNEAFRTCTSLSSVAIPHSVTVIGKNAFLGCSALTAVHITDLTAWCRVQFNDDTYSNPLIYAHHLYLNGEEIHDLVIPDGVTTLVYTFTACYGLTSVTIPNSLTTIEDYTFHDCPNMTKVTLNSNAVASRQYSDHPSFNYLFGNQVTEYVIGEDVTTIGDHAFENCTNVTAITIPYSVTTIGKGLFRGCTGLTSVTISNGVTVIDQEAFYGCTSLATITLPSSITDIKKSAFSGCTSLTSVVIPSQVTFFGDNVFNGCTSLTHLYCYAEEPPRTGIAFNESHYDTVTLHVPAASIPDYQNFPIWYHFKHIIALANVDPKPTNVEHVTVFNVNSRNTVYDLNGRRRQQPQKGLNIINGRTVNVDCNATLGSVRER